MAAVTVLVVGAESEGSYTLAPRTLLAVADLAKKFSKRFDADVLTEGAML